MNTNNETLQSFFVFFCPFLPPVNLCSNPEDKLQIYRDNFEKAYLDSTERFYRTQAPSYLQQNGVQNYMKYADTKLREEEKRALRYLETRRECNSVQAVSVIDRI